MLAVLKMKLNGFACYCTSIVSITSNCAQQLILILVWAFVRRLPQLDSILTRLSRHAPF